MELHQLRYLLAVARSGNFSRAAAHCHVSQPSLSQQIRKLEEEVGEKLFSRLKRHSVLTAAGEAMVIRAARILDEVEAARRDVADCGELLRGQIRLGVLPTVAPYLLPAILCRAAREFPGLHIVIYEETTARLLEMTAACEIDLAIISVALEDERFVLEALFEEDLLLAVPAGHRLAAGGALQVADIREEDFLLMKEGHCLGEQTLAFCGRLQEGPRVVFRSAQLETIQALVAAGVGISLIPEMASRRQEGRELVYRSFAEPRPRRVIHAAWRRQNEGNRATREFLRLLREVCVPAPKAGGTGVPPIMAKGVGPKMRARVGAAALA